MKKLMALAMLVCVTMFAVEQLPVIDNPSMNYTVVNYKTKNAKDPAHHISLTITETGSLWMHNDITEWAPADLGTIIDMNAGKYGAILQDGTLVPGTGDKALFVYEDVDHDGEIHDIQTPGYFVGNFVAGTKLHFWITTLPDDSEYGNSLDEIASGANEKLTARYDDQIDWVDHPIMDFKFASGNATGEYGVGDWMFVFATGNIVDGQPINGTPLPGTLATLLVFGGLLGGYKKMKKSKKA